MAKKERRLQEKNTDFKQVSFYQERLDVAQRNTHNYTLKNVSF